MLNFKTIYTIQFTKTSVLLVQIWPLIFIL